MAGLCKSGNEPPGSIKANLLVKRNEITGEWRQLHNAQLHALCSSPNIIGNFKSGRLRWAGLVARMEQSRNAYRV